MAAIYPLERMVQSLRTSFRLARWLSHLVDLRNLPFFAPARRQMAGWFVLAWSNDRLLLAHASHQGGEKPEVHLLAEEPVPYGDVEALRQVARRYRLSRYRVSLLLPLSDYQMLLVDAPGVPRQELKAAVRWRVKELLDYHVDDATIDVLEIPQGAGGAVRPGQLYVVAAHNRVIKAAIDLCQQAEVPLAAIDIPEMASRNVANLLAEPERGVALLSFTEAGGLITVSFNGELLFARHIEVTRGNLGGEGYLENYYDRITLEVQRSLDYVDRQLSFAAVSRLWLAPFAEVEALRHELANNLYVPVEVVDLAALFDFSANGEWVAPAWQERFFLPLGATLRTEAATL